MTVKEKMHAGEPYVMADDPELMNISRNASTNFLSTIPCARPKQRKRRRC